MKLSVCLITFNHKRFIAQALEGALAQKANFHYEIVVGDDCSLDGTREIAIGYQQRYPSKIRLALPERNLGTNRNLAQTLRACRGQYIALLEGDDYWTCSTKLQEQVDFLDAYTECAICFHAVKVFYEDGSSTPRKSPRFGFKKISTLEDLLTRGNFMPTCSIVFRNGLFGELPDWFYSLRIADFPINVFNAQHGEIGYLNKVMGAYRIHRGGTFSGESGARNTQEVVRLYDHVNAHLNYRYSRTIKSIQSYWKAVDYYRQGDIANARACAAERAAAPPFNTQAVMAWLLTHLPRLYRLVRSLRRSL